MQCHVYCTYPAQLAFPTSRLRRCAPAVAAPKNPLACSRPGHQLPAQPAVPPRKEKEKDRLNARGLPSVAVCWGLEQGT